MCPIIEISNLKSQISNQVFDYESLFPFVNKPSRYIGREWNSIRKSESFRKNSVGVCLCFPDLYETGFANMGIEILYQKINGREDAYAERAYSADSDFAALLREKKWPFFSLESRTPLAQFDIVGFSLPYELCYPNILEILDLAQIPLRSEQRDENVPLIIGGGPCAVNPEPVADFFDAIVLGDGEEIIDEIIETVKKFKHLKLEKKLLLKELSKIPSLYVPSLYDVRYRSDGTVAEIAPKFSDVPQKISYRVTDIKKPAFGKFSFPTVPVVPFVQTIHDRLNVEIQRGCPSRCRFCQAGFTYHHYRERSKEELLKIIEEGLRHTGYDAITLSGLSSADHTEIMPLLHELSAMLTERRVSIGLPSTRADCFTLTLAEILQNVRRQSLTFAPEAGTERLRAVIRKNLSESEVRKTIKTSYQHGWKNIKLYFMFGLPTENQTDLEGMVDLVKECGKECRGLSFTLTLAPFVPKPHTPFQWHPQNSLETHKEKLNFLRKNLSAQIRAHNVEQILVEGILSRGDRKCSLLLETAWKMGCKFDEWSEKFRFDLWLKGIEETRCTPEFYCYRQREKDEILPWDHLCGGPEKNALWNDYQNSLQEAPQSHSVPSSGQPSDHETVSDTPMKTESRDSASCFTPSNKRAQMFQDKTVQRLRFKLSRKGSVRFLSHLEQIEMIRRVLRRTGLPVAYTSGFHPQMKCSFGPAVSVGYESDCEYFDIDFSKRVDLEQAQKEISSQLADGFTLLKASRIPLFFPSLESLINRVDYIVAVPCSVEKNNFENAAESLKFFLNQPEIIFQKIKKDGSRIKSIPISLKPLIIKMEWMRDSFENSASKENDRSIFLSMKLGPGKNVKPEKVVALYLQCSENNAQLLKVSRKSFFIEKQDGSAVEP